MATLAEELAKKYGGTTQSILNKQPSSGMPISFDVRTYQPSTTTSGSTTQQKQTPQQIIQAATGGKSGGSTKLPLQNQTPLPQTGQQIVQDIVGNMQPNQGSMFNPNQPSITQGMSFGGTDTSQAQGGFKYVPPPVSAEESAGIAKNYGLAGLGRGDQFAGMTKEQAEKEAKKKQDLYKSQTSAGTSYTYNPQTIAGFNQKTKEMQTKVDDINNSVWSSSGDKKTNVDATIKSYTNQLAGLFNTPEEFQNALNTNPEFDKSVQEYQRMGGDVNAITSTINQKAQTPQVDGVQTLDQYLGRVSTPAEKKAYESLIPEQKSLQAQIAFENGIVEKYREYYFGDSDTIGLVQQKKEMAIEKANILAEQAKLASDNAKAQADLLIQKDKADMEAADAETEENSIQAQNYATNMLAKLGALNTSSAAGEMLIKIKERYQKQKQANKAKYGMMMRETEVKLGSTLNDLESQKMESIFKVKEDLSKDEQDVMKEVFKLETDATRKSFDAVDKYLGMYRSQKEKYIKEAKAAATKAARDASSAMSTYNLSAFMSQKYQQGVPTPLLGAKNAPYNNQPSASIPEYLKQVTNKASLNTKAVIEGKKSFYSMPITVQKQVEKELKGLGISPDILPESSFSVKKTTEDTTSNDEFLNQLKEIANK